MSARPLGIGTTLGSLVVGLILGVIIGPVIGSFVLLSPDDYVRRVEAWGAFFGGITASFTLLFLTWELIESQRDKDERLVLDHYNAIANQLSSLGQHLPFHVFRWDASKNLWRHKRSGWGIMGLSQELAAQKVEQEEGLMRPRDIAVPFSLLLGYCRPAEELLDSVGTHTKTVFAPIAAMLDFIYPEVLRNYYKNGIVARKLREDEGLALIRRAVEADPTVKDAWRTLLENDYIVDAWQTEVGSHTYRIVAEAIEAASDKPPIEIDGEVGAALHEMAKAVLERETGK